MPKRSYGQYCGLARALDIIGGRWSLLIVRELLVGPARYGELLAGLPGIATNLLSERLRELEQVGIVERALASEGNGVVYMLTPWGSELRGAVGALVNWSTPLMVPGPAPDDEFRGHWLVVALTSLLPDRRSKESTTVGVTVDDEIVSIRVDETGTHVELCRGAQPATVLRGDAAIVLGLASGMLTVEQAIACSDLHGREEDLVTAFGRA